MNYHQQCSVEIKVENAIVNVSINANTEFCFQN